MRGQAKGGGSWNNEARNARAAYRNRNNNLGFRLALRPGPAGGRRQSL
jgi:hypothetical protein